MPEIFICYRRDDSPGHARQLYSDLADTFGREAVFFDRESLPPGDDFEQAIDRALAASNIVLVLIGPDWRADELHAEGDYVRREIDTAMRGGKRVIPLLVGNGKLPAQADLPNSLGRFPFRQAHELSDGLWNASVADLVARIGGTGGTRPPRPREPARWTPQDVTRLVERATISLCLLLVMLTFCAIAVRQAFSGDARVAIALAGISGALMLAVVVPTLWRAAGASQATQSSGKTEP